VIGRGAQFPPAGAGPTPADVTLQALTTEVSALRHQVEALTERLTGTRPGPAAQEPALGEDTPGLTARTRRRNDGWAAMRGDAVDEEPQPAVLPGLPSPEKFTRPTGTMR
jgi:hypothetical protein